MTSLQASTAKVPARKAYGASTSIADRWVISSRPVGSTDAGDQASPSIFAGTEAKAMDYCAQRSAETALPGHGPAREYLFRGE